MCSHVSIKTKIFKTRSGQYSFKIVSGTYSQGYPYLFKCRESAQEAATLYAVSIAKDMSADVVTVDESDIINF